MQIKFADSARPGLSAIDQPANEVIFVFCCGF